MKTLKIESPTKYTRTCEVPAWDENYIILPGEYEIKTKEYHEGHPFEYIDAQVEVVYAKKSALFGGVAVTEATGPEKGEVMTIEIPVRKIWL